MSALVIVLNILFLLGLVMMTAGIHLVGGIGSTLIWVGFWVAFIAFAVYYDEVYADE